MGHIRAFSFFSALFACTVLSFAVYPVAVAHLMDHVDAEDLLPACSTVLLLHGLGAAFGPALPASPWRGSARGPSPAISCWCTS
jgi:hypothetical protein